MINDILKVFDLFEEQCEAEELKSLVRECKKMFIEKERLKSENKRLNNIIKDINKILKDDDLCHIEKLQEIHKLVGSDKE